MPPDTGKSRITDGYFAPDIRVAEPPTGVCEGCGGIYQQDSLQSQQRVNISTWYNKATEKSTIIEVGTKKVRFCEFCIPEGDITFTLNDNVDHGADDILAFNVLRTGFFQEIDSEEGTDRFSISDEQYTSITCAECGEFLKCTKCKCDK